MTGSQPATRIDYGHGYAEYNPANMVRMGGRLVPRLITGYIAGAPDLPAATLTIEVRDDGAPVCTRVVVEAKPHGREVRVTDLRRIRLEDTLEVIVSAVAQTVIATDAEGNPTILGPAAGTDAVRRIVVEDVRAARRGTRKTLTDADLRTVAEVYNGHPGRGIKAVEDVYGVSHSTAARWIARARTRNLITKRGRP